MKRLNGTGCNLAQCNNPAKRIMAAAAGTDLPDQLRGGATAPEWRLISYYPQSWWYEEGSQRDPSWCRTFGSDFGGVDD